MRELFTDSDIKSRGSVSMGDVIRAYREKIGSLGDISNIADGMGLAMSRSRLCRIENGNVGISFSTIDLLSSLLGVHPMILNLQLMKLRWLDKLEDPLVAEAMDNLIRTIETLPDQK